MLRNYSPLILMCLCLESFRIKITAPVQGISQQFCLMLNVRISPIFCQHQPLPGIFFFHFFNPGFDILYLFLIPSEITVHSLYIGIPVNRMFCMAITIDSHRITIRIFQFAEIVNRLSKSSRITMRMIHLVMNSPHINRRMIETLTYQLAHLLMNIIPLLPCHTVHKRNLSPDNKSQRITT